MKLLLAERIGTIFRRCERDVDSDHVLRRDAGLDGDQPREADSEQGRGDDEDVRERELGTDQRVLRTPPLARGRGAAEAGEGSGKTGPRRAPRRNEAEAAC